MNGSLLSRISPNKVEKIGYELLLEEQQNSNGRVHNKASSSNDKINHGHVHLSSKKKINFM